MGPRQKGKIRVIAMGIDCHQIRLIATRVRQVSPVSTQRAEVVGLSELLRESVCLVHFQVCRLGSNW